MCLELRRRGPRPFAVCHRCAQVVPAGSHPPQLRGTADSCSLDGVWAASTDISLLPVVSVCARWMLADVQWCRTHALMHTYGSSAVHSNALFELDPLHASDHYDRMCGVCRGQRGEDRAWERDEGGRSHVEGWIERDRSSSCFFWSRECTLPDRR